MIERTHDSESCCCVVCDYLVMPVMWLGRTITYIYENTLLVFWNAFLSYINRNKREEIIDSPTPQTANVSETPSPRSASPSPKDSPVRTKTPESQNTVVVEQPTPPRTLPKVETPGFTDRLKNMFSK